MSRIAKIIAGASHQDHVTGASQDASPGHHLAPVATADRNDYATSGSLGSALLNWADFDISPRVIVDANLMLVWANRAAVSQFSEQRDLINRNGQLTCTNPAHQQTLQEFVGDAERDIASLCLTCDDRQGHLVIRAQRICELSLRPTFGLTFYRSDDRFQARFADLQQVFQLTRAEHDTLQHMIDGHTAEEVANIKGVSIETIRSQIRQIYVKLNVKSREALFFRIRPFRL